jgi:hypothetical protein
MISINLSEHLKQWRIDRSDEWKMDEFIRQAKELEDISNDLKCCGNCKHYTPRGDCRSKHGFSPGHYCKFWYLDGLKRKERENEKL